MWEKVRVNGIDQIELLEINMFEAGDAFRLLGTVGAVSGASKIVSIEGGYETREGGSLTFEFQGPVSDAQPVKEFLEPQLRDAADRDLKVRFKLAFSAGLSMHGDVAQKLTERLTRFASGAAYVSATAKVKA